MIDPELERRWIDLGLLDPSSAIADERRELLAWLSAQGIDDEVLVDACRQRQLSSIAGDLALRPGRRHTATEVAEAVGMSVEAVEELRLATGLPGSPEAAFTPDDIEMFRLYAAARSFFSLPELLHFARVIASSMRRIAEAAGEMFLLDVEAEMSTPGSSTELERAETNLAAIELARGAVGLFDPLFRWQLELANQATRIAREGQSSYDTVTLAVGFVDLSGFTTRAARVSASELLAIVLDFETTAYDLVAEHGGRVVKLIGDEVMFTTVAPDAARSIALGLVDRFSTTDTSARGGVAFGPVLAHGGDLYGETVNLASRIADIAVPGEVLVSAAIADGLPGVCTIGAGRRQLKGFAEPLPLWSLC